MWRHPTNHALRSRTTPRTIFTSRSLTRLRLERAARRRLRRLARHVADHVASGHRVAPAARSCPRRPGHSPLLAEERTRRASKRLPPPTSANRVVPKGPEGHPGEQHGGNDRTRTEPRVVSRSAKSKTPPSARGAFYREVRTPRSLAVPNGRVAVRTRLAIASTGDCSPHEGTRNAAPRSFATVRGLFPNEEDDLHRRRCLFYR